MAGLTEGLQKVEGRAQRTGGSEQKGSEMGEVRKAEFLEAAAVCFFPPPAASWYHRPAQRVTTAATSPA